MDTALKLLALVVWMIGLPTLDYIYGRWYQKTFDLSREDFDKRTKMSEAALVNVWWLGIIIIFVFGLMTS